MVETACQELLNIGYDLYIHLKKIEKCSYVSVGEIPARFGGTERFIFNSTFTGLIENDL